VDVVFDLFRVARGHAREAAHLHPHIKDCAARHRTC
jgi:hypothetical protein